MNQIVVGMAGHIDHGKTSIIKSLTGTKTERYTEEVERGLTIDIGFAFLSENITYSNGNFVALCYETKRKGNRCATLSYVTERFYA